MGKAKKKLEDLRTPRPKPSPSPASSPATALQTPKSPVNLWQSVHGNYGTAWRMLGGVLAPSQGQGIANLDRLLQGPAEESKPSGEGLEPDFSLKRGAALTTKDGEVQMENTVSASGSLKVPLLPELKAGPLASLQEIEFESTAESKSETVQSLLGTIFSTLETSAQLAILELEIKKLGFSLEGGLTGKGSVTEHYGPETGRTGELAAEAKGKAGYESPSLRLGPLGTLRASATAEGTAGVTRSLGKAPGATPSAPSEASKISAAFEAQARALLESVGLSLGSVKVRLIGDVHSKLSVDAEPGETSQKAGVGGMIGVRLETKKFKATLKLIGDTQKSLAPEPGQKSKVNVVVNLEF